MPVTVTPHLNFRGQAREALTYYQSVFGGDLMLATYQQIGAPTDTPDADHATFTPVDPDSPDADSIAFGLLVTETGMRLAAYDVYGAAGDGLAGSDLLDSGTRGDGLTHDEQSFMLLTCDTLDQATPLWTALVSDGTIIQNLAPADWAPAYGMLTDRYGLTWIFGIQPS